MYIDAHSHWTHFDPEKIDFLLARARALGITQFMQAGVNPEGWEKQIILSEKYPNIFLNSFGLHPYFVAENNEEVCDQAMDLLALQIGKAVGIGETGLDFRPHICKNSEDLQFTFFENHIALAKVVNKPMVLHIVQAHDEAIRALKIWEPPQSAGMIHAFNGSIEIAQEYLKMGFMISVGGAVTFEKNQKLRNAVKKIPLNAILIESDAPDQSPAGWGFDQNDSSSCFQIAQEVATLKETTAEIILKTATINFKTLFRV